MFHDRSEDALAAAAAKVEHACLARNRVTVAEFEKYMPLWQEHDAPIDIPAGDFDRDPNKTVSPMHALANDFCNRFNLMAEITVVSDNGPDAEIVQVVPPIFTRTKTVTEVAGDDPTMTTFSETMQRERHPMRADHEIATRRALALIKKLGDPEEADRQRQIFEDTMEEGEDSPELSDDDAIWE